MADAAAGPLLLEVAGVTKIFGGIAAVQRGQPRRFAAGRAWDWSGPTAPGKTTLFNCICGQLRPERGRVELEGVDLLDLPTYKRARLGIGRTYQRIEVFPDMTVRDHLLVAVRARWCTGRLWQGPVQPERARPPTSRAGGRGARAGRASPTRPTAPVAVLGLGSCRLVELARALVCRAGPAAGRRAVVGSRRPRDPRAGQRAADAPARAGHGRAAGRARPRHGGRGGGPHDRDEPGNGHRRRHLRRGDGRPRWSARPTSGCRHDPAGEPAVGAPIWSTSSGEPRSRRSRAGGPEVPTRGDRGTGAPALEVDHVSASYGPYRALFDVTFTVPESGVTALIGSNGAGKSTVARVVTGLLASTAGTVRLSGRDVTGLPATRSPGPERPTSPRAGASSPISPSRRT